MNEEIIFKWVRYVIENLLESVFEKVDSKKVKVDSKKVKVIVHSSNITKICLICWRCS